MSIKDFYDLEAWKSGHEFVIKIYKLTSHFPKSELYGIISQLRRAASSVTANIAEGFSRYHFKDKIKFYYISRGSISECQNYLLISKDIQYLDNNEFNLYWDQAEKTRKILNGLIRSTGDRIEK